MTTPDLSWVIPKKYKAIAALIGSALSFVVPYVLQAESLLPSPWPAVIGVVLFILSTLGVYHAPYAPPNTVLVHQSDVATPDLPAASPRNPIPPAPGYTNPWQS